MDYLVYLPLILGLIATTVFIFNSHYRWTYFFAIAQFVFFSSIMFAFTGQWQRALNFACVLFVVLMLFHRLKIHYYKQPLLMSDFFLAFDFRNWETLLHYKGSIFAILGLFALLGYGVFFYAGMPALGGVWQGYGAVVAILAFGLMAYFTRNSNAIKTWLDSLPDDGRDVFLNLPMSLRGVFFSRPHFQGDGKRFAEKLRQLDPPLQSNERPTIVAWLCESTLDPMAVALAQANVLEMQSFSAKQCDFASDLRVHTVGGGTWKSEFAFLTGLPPTDFGAMASAVFYSVAPHTQFSLVKNLQQAGYFCVALTPFTKGNYNAQAAYDSFGFDLVLQPQDLGYPAPMSKNLWHITSEEMATYTEMILDRKHPEIDQDKPLFVYVLTMKEHGPYAVDTPNHFDLHDPALSSAMIGELNDYFSRLQALDRTLLDFYQKLSNRNRPFVLAYFGDHQPNLNGTIMPQKRTYARPEYVTQCAVRAKSAVNKVENVEILDLSQLGGVILEMAGVAPDPFFQANIGLRKCLAGSLDDLDLNDDTKRQLKADYLNYLYHHLNVVK